MLVLTRKVGQGIVISGNILVCVLGIERGRVKIGVAAPPDTLVLREEVLDKPKPGPRKQAKARQEQRDRGRSVPGDIRRGAVRAVRPHTTTRGRSITTNEPRSTR